MSDEATATRKLIDFETDYYGSLKLIDWFNIERVRSARMMVVGAGAIGNEVLKNLALLGIGHIYIIDRDTVEISNLSRSILYRAADRGQPKATTAARTVREINPDVKVFALHGDLSYDLGLGLLRRMDVVIGCLDNREARLKLNTNCFKAGRPWVDAGIGQLNGHARVFHPAEGACYECSFNEDDYRQISLPCEQLASMYASRGKMPTTPTIASIVAGVQVQESLKLLDLERWQGRILAGRQFDFNGTVGNVSISLLPRRPDCPAHVTFGEGEIVELTAASATRTTVAELLDMLREHLGGSAVVELNFELAVAITCERCGFVKQLMQPRGQLFQEQLSCERCGRTARLITTHRLGDEETRGFRELMEARLIDINVPPLDILTARNEDGAVLSFELTGDEGHLLRPVQQSIQP